jgi:hypothetical protein
MTTPTSKFEVTTQSRSRKLIVLAIVLAVIIFGYFAFRTMRGLIMLGFVDSAIVRVRVISAAETQFAKEHPETGYTCSLSRLPASGEIKRLLAKDQIDNGYSFEVAGCEAAAPQKPNSMYYVTARPMHTRQPAFCSDQSGIVKSDAGGDVEKCLANGTPLGS